MAITQRKYFSANFSQEPVNIGMLEGATAAPAVTDNLVHVYTLSRPGHFLAINNTGQNDIKVPVLSANGWVLPCDDTDADGIEFNPSTGLIAGAGGPLQFTIGTDPAFFIQAAFLFGAGLDDHDVVQIGFRKQAAYGNVDSPANLTVYTDIATVGVNDNAGAIATNTDNDNAGIVTTALTATPHTLSTYLGLRVNVSAAGAVTYKVAISAASAAAAISGLAVDASAVAFSFDDGDVVIPCGFLVSTGAGTTDVTLCHLSCGHT